MGGAIICSLFKSVLAHQQPINDMQVSRDHVITASQDHTLKVIFPNYYLPVPGLDGRGKHRDIVQKTPSLS